MLISVAKIRQVSEFAKLLAEILSEVAKRRNGSRADFRISILTEQSNRQSRLPKQEPSPDPFKNDQ